MILWHDEYTIVYHQLKGRFQIERPVFELNNFLSILLPVERLSILPQVNSNHQIHLVLYCQD